MAGGRREESHAPLLDYRGPSEPDIHGTPPTAKQADVVYGKITKRILPFVFFAALLSGLMLLGNQKLILASLYVEYESQVFLWVYNIAFVFFQIPSTAVLARLGAPLWLGVLLICVGLVEIVLTFVFSPGNVLSFVIGVLQAGFLPGLAYYLSQFFPLSRIAMVMGVTVGGFAAYDILYFLLTLLGWVLGHYFYLVLGIPTIVFGALMIAYLPKDPNWKKFLTEEEQAILKGDKCTAAPTSSNQSSLSQCWKLLANSDIWLIIGIGSLVQIMLEFGCWRVASLVWEIFSWGPFEGAASLTYLVRAIFSGLVGLSAGVLGWSSEKLRDRTYHLAVLLLLGAILFFVSPFVAALNYIAAIVVLTIGSMAVGGCSGAYYSLQMSNFTKENMALGLAWVGTAVNAIAAMWLAATAFMEKIIGNGHWDFWVIGVLGVLMGVTMIFLEDKVRNESRRKKAEV